MLPSTDTNKIAVMYLTAFAGGLTAFVFCSYWVYHYVDLGLDANDDEEDEDQEDLTSTNTMMFHNLSPLAEAEMAHYGLPRAGERYKPRAM